MQKPKRSPLADPNIFDHLQKTQIDAPSIQRPAGKQPHIYIAIPCYGGQIFEACFMSLLKFSVAAPRWGLNWTVDTMVNESLIPRGRNNLVSKFLHNQDATHLMFIDADIRWKPEYIPMLLQTGKDLVCGLYPMKCVPPRFVINSLPNPHKEGPLEEVSTAGTGFMLIQRHVIEDMIKKHPELKYNDNIGIGKQYEPFMYDLFDTMIDEHKNYLSEDWTFCYRWRKMGNKVWVHKDVILDHQGTYSFLGKDAVENHKQIAEKYLAEQAAKQAAANSNTVSNVSTETSSQN